MAGKKGMIRQSNADTIRRNIWRSMQILRKFTAPDIIRTVPGGTYSNVTKYLSLLIRHGYVVKSGTYRSGLPDQYQTYILKRGPRDHHPIHCDRCGQSLSKPCNFLADAEKKEIKKETEKEKAPKGPGEINHDAA